MKYYYISSKADSGGISNYAKTFYECVLLNQGYIFVDSGINSDDILSTITSKDKVHIEIGIFQKKEIEILMLMLDANYRNVTITLHDPPLLKYPFNEFRNSILQNVSKFYDKYLNGSKSITTRYLNKIETIYVLSALGKKFLQSKYSLNNIHYLPHIINPKQIENDGAINKNLLYFGFIGQNKGIEYSLKLHEKLLSQNPEVQFYVIGSARGKEITFYENLKKKYIKNVHYLGYLSEKDLNQVFNKASFAILPFKDYKFYKPVSGSILYCLLKGKIILTNKANTISETITDNKNGIFLSGSINKDVEIIQKIFANESKAEFIRKEALAYLELTHSPEAVIRHLKN